MSCENNSTFHSFLNFVSSHFHLDFFTEFRINFILFPMHFYPNQFIVPRSDTEAAFNVAKRHEIRNFLQKHNKINLIYFFRVGLEKYFTFF